MSERRYSFDVVVVGGGTAGIAAAIGAAKVGAKTLLIEKNPYFGGALTHSSVFTICGMYSMKDPLELVVGGVGGEVLEHVRNMGMSYGPYRNPSTKNVGIIVDPEAVKTVFDRMLIHNKVIPLLHCQVTNAIVSNGEIRAIECFDHSGFFTVESKAFVDASGEADLTAFAGGSIRAGKHESDFQIGSLVMRIGGVSHINNLERTYIYEAIKQAKIEGVNLTKEKGALIQMPGSNDILAIFADAQINGLDSFSITNAEMYTRDQAWKYINVFKKYVPGFENAYLVQTGPSIGIRETRHVIGEYTLTGEDVIEGRSHEDSVALGGWPVEIHAAPGKPVIYKQIRDLSYYQIPLRALKEKTTKNLWCSGRIISCDQTAFGSARVMGTAFATGHAAGIAASLYAQSGNVNYKSVQQHLIQQKALI
ncbi:FAD-dependent oxidoreductase [Bacillus massiliigorillae]|uniref:FAD-dependent oxidoreductase n=1 Tax=Bacillus massiliigorillae TaxID=1243664 RepID=UPI0003AA2227|nr:FAD-dependent oxidoreductase [Bacillus massiliigorillae]